ncbi:chorismate-binding protein [Streptomyces anulatus]|uniref:chorismate-binding protein n=1 Tax=Streptomyces anulatus TaxID=1892 RepID=UPI0033E44515
MTSPHTSGRGASPSPAAHLMGRLVNSPRPPAFALLRRRGARAEEPVPVELLIGTVTDVESISAIPLAPTPVETPEGTPPREPGPEVLALVPFRQIRERGFACHDDGTPLRVLRVEESHTLDEADLLAALPDVPVRLDGAGFDLDDDAYAAAVERIVHEEIGPGTGANFVIRRDFTARLADPGPAAALTIFRRLLTSETGAYWTFCVHTGPVEAARDGGAGQDGHTLVGASPEAHVRVRGDEVVMNPISGTYRYPAAGPDTDSLLTFLADSKERNELSMVVDEELKMLCAVADRDVRLHGPYLREMSHLAHTEFEIRGRGVKEVREVLSRTMFAATVTGSPLKSACRVIRAHEPSGRGYYAGALALFGQDASGQRWLDSPITIRTADITPDGALRIPVGATLVRDSDPRSEVAETHAKLAGVLSAFGVTPARDAAARPAPGASLCTPEVLAALGGRRRNLAPCWLDPDLHGSLNDRTDHGRKRLKEVLVVDAEDDFTAMLAHLLRAAGLGTSVVPYDHPALREALRHHRGPVLLGPGPGNPNDAADPRIGALRELTAELLGEARGGGNPLVGVCLGFQLLSGALGLPVLRGERPYQGTQRVVEFFGRPVTAGFYSSFRVHADPGQTSALLAKGVEISRDPATHEVTALRGRGISGVQFHPESVLSLSGPEILLELLREAVGRAPVAASRKASGLRH